MYLRAQSCIILINMANIEGLGPYSTECLEFFETLELREAAKQAVIEAAGRKFTSVAGVTMLGVDVPAGIKKT